MPAKKTWTDEDLKEAVAAGKSYRDVVRRLGLKIAGGTCKSIKNAILLQEHSTDHFVKLNPKSKEETAIKPNISVFSFESKATKNTIKRILRRHILIPYQCKCGLIDEWQGRKLVLQLEHKNGNTKDNRLENLEWLCANCHSQTSTFAGRNRNPENWKDGRKISGRDYSEVENSPGLNKRKVPFDEVARFYESCGNLRETARNFDIAHQSVSYILNKFPWPEAEN